MEYDGFLVSGALVASPSIQLDDANRSLGAQATWVLFESGNQILQFSGAGAWLTRPRGGLRVEFSGSFGAGYYEEADGYGHFLARSRLHYSGSTSGGWVSAGTGASFGGVQGTPVEVGMGGWSLMDRVGLAGSITATAVAGGSYIDLLGAARWSASRLRMDARIGARGFSGGEGGGAYAELSMLYSVSSRFVVNLSGGRYRSDPARGVVGAKYINLGLRINLSRAREPVVPTIGRALVQVQRELISSDYASPGRLEVQSVGSGHIILMYAPGATSVEIMGDFTDWLPVALRHVAGDEWELEATLPAGPHRVNVRIDGGPWLVPLGTRMEETEFGGAVGIVVVPQ